MREASCNAKQDERVVVFQSRRGRISDELRRRRFNLRHLFACLYDVDRQRRVREFRGLDRLRKLRAQHRLRERIFEALF